MKKINLFTTLYIPLFRTALIERKLKGFSSNGYEPISFSRIAFSFFRVRFQRVPPKEKQFYVFSRFNAGGVGVAYNSPVKREERKIALISQRTISINSDILVAELKDDANPEAVLKSKKEKLKEAQKLYFSFLLFELALLPALFILCYFFVPHDILFREPITLPPSLYLFAIFPIYAGIGAIASTKELKRLGA